MSVGARDDLFPWRGLSKRQPRTTGRIGSSSPMSRAGAGWARWSWSRPPEQPLSRHFMRCPDRVVTVRRQSGSLTGWRSRRERAWVVTVPVSVTLGESSGPLLVSTMCPWARPGDGEFDRLVVGVDREQEPVVAGVAVNAFRCDRRRGPRRACWWPGSSGLPRHLLAVGPVVDRLGGAALGPVQILAGS
jgi:hypothetical protein